MRARHAEYVHVGACTRAYAYVCVCIVDAHVRVMHAQLTVSVSSRWNCVFLHNFSGVKRTCWTTGSWRSCLSLEVVSSIPAGSTIIYRFLCGFICVSLCQSIKIKPTNMYIASARAQFKINTHRCWNWHLCIPDGLSVVQCSLGHVSGIVFFDTISVTWSVRAGQLAAGGVVSVWRSWVRSPPGPRWFIGSFVGLYAFPCARASKLNQQICIVDAHVRVMHAQLTVSVSSRMPTICLFFSYSYLWCIVDILLHLHMCQYASVSLYKYGLYLWRCNDVWYA